MCQHFVPEDRLAGARHRTNNPNLAREATITPATYGAYAQMRDQATGLHVHVDPLQRAPSRRTVAATTAAAAAAPPKSIMGSVLGKRKY